MPDQSSAHTKKGPTVRTVTIGLLTILLISFALMNLQTAQVRPFGEKPVIMVILISFILGAMIGWLVRRPLSSKRNGA